MAYEEIIRVVKTQAGLVVFLPATPHTPFSAVSVRKAPRELRWQAPVDPEPGRDTQLRHSRRQPL